MPPNRIAHLGIGYLPRGARHLRQPLVRREPDAAASGPAGRHVRRRDLRDVPEPEGAAPQPGHQALRRRAADAGGGRILRTGAELLLLDELSEGLAPVIVQPIGRTIRELKRKGFTILLVEQNFRFAATARRPPLRDGARPRRRHDPERRARAKHAHAERAVWASETPRCRQGDSERMNTSNSQRLLAAAAALCRCAPRRRAQPATRSRSACSTTCRASTPTSPASRRRWPPRWRSRTSAARSHGKPSSRARRPPEQGRYRGQHRPAVVRLDGVDMIFGRAPTRPALAMNEVAREKNKVFIISAPATSDADRRSNASPNTVHWAYDTVALAHGHRRRRWSSRAARAGSSSPPTTPSAMRSSATRRGGEGQGRQGGGRGARTRSTRRTSPPSCSRRRPRRRKVLGLANAGGDTINAIKQARRIRHQQGGMKLAGAAGVHHRRARLGLSGAGPDAHHRFYWDLNDRHAPSPSASRRQDRAHATRRWCRPAPTRPCCTT